MAFGASSKLTITPLGGALGARVDGADITDAPGDTDMATLRGALCEHLVLVLPGQAHATPAELEAFARQWGEIFHGYRQPTVDGSVGELHALPGRPLGNDQWHVDQTFLERPPTPAFLLARIIPPAGGDTMWASMYQAYASLSEEMRRVLEGLRAVHSGAPYYRSVGGATAEAPTFVHPAVITIPETGRRVLYLNERFVTQFEGMTERESAPLLQFLFSHATQPHFTFRHSWTPGDLAIWDERTTQHIAIKDYDAERLMHRVLTVGPALSSSTLR